jgi:hypothetical protein
MAQSSKSESSIKDKVATKSLGLDEDLNLKPKSSRNCADSDSDSNSSSYKSVVLCDDKKPISPSTRPFSPSTGNSMEEILLKPNIEVINPDGCSGGGGKINSPFKFGVKCFDKMTYCMYDHPPPHKCCNKGCTCPFLAIGICKFYHPVSVYNTITSSNSKLAAAYENVSDDDRREAYKLKAINDDKLIKLNYKFTEALKKRDDCKKSLKFLTIKLSQTKNTLKQSNQNYENAFNLSVSGSEDNVKILKDKVSTVSSTYDELVLSVNEATITLKYAENTLNQCTKNLEKEEKNQKKKP